MIQNFTGKTVTTLTNATKEATRKRKVDRKHLNVCVMASKEQVNEQLSKLEEKVKALKAQLDFRKKVLEQTHTEKDVLFITKQSKQLLVEVICENLCKLLSSAHLVNTMVALKVALCDDEHVTT